MVLTSPFHYTMIFSKAKRWLQGSCRVSQRFWIMWVTTWRSISVVTILRSAWLSPRNFFRGGGESIDKQISIVILLFSDQISGRGKVFKGGGGAPPPPPRGRKPAATDSNSLELDNTKSQQDWKVLTSVNHLCHLKTITSGKLTKFPQNKVSLKFQGICL